MPGTLVTFTRQFLCANIILARPIGPMPPKNRGNADKGDGKPPSQDDRTSDLASQGDMTDGIVHQIVENIEMNIPNDG